MGRIAGGDCESEESAGSGADRLPVAPLGVDDVDDGPTTAFVTDVFPIKLIATTWERDCILCCCSIGGIVVAADDGTTEAVVVVDDSDEDDVVFPLVLTDALAFGTVLPVSTIGGRGGFGTW